MPPRPALLSTLLLAGRLAVRAAETAPAAFAERPVLDPIREAMPGHGFWDPHDQRGLWLQASTESTGDGASLMLYTPDERSRTFYKALAYGDFVQVGPERNDLREWDGLSFWFRGDGSAGEGFFALDPDLRTGVRFQLYSRDWQKIYLPWSALRIDPAARTNGFNHIVLGVYNPGHERENYVFEDFRVVREGEDLYPRIGRGRTRAEDTQMVRYGTPGKTISLPRTRLDGTQGFRISVRGGGGSLRGFVHWHGQREQGMAFPLLFDEWRHSTITWRELPPPEFGDPVYLVFGFEERETRGQRYWIDRINFHRGPRIKEEIRPTPPRALPRHLSALDFLERADGLEHLRPRLRANGNVSLVILSDGIGAGERLNLLSPGPFATSDKSYSYLLYYRLVTNYLLKKGQFLFEVYEPRGRNWLTLNTPTAFSTGLTVANFGVRGTDPEHFARAYQRSFHYKPDAVFLQFGTSDALYRTPEQYEADLVRMLDRIQADQRLPVLITPVPASDPVPGPDGVSPLARSADIAERCRKIARARKLPLIDAHAAFLAGGELSLGEVYWDRSHLNILGHRYLSDLLFSMVTGNTAMIWNETPDAISDLIRTVPDLPSREDYISPPPLDTDEPVTPLRPR